MRCSAGVPPAPVRTLFNLESIGLRLRPFTSKAEGQDALRTAGKMPALRKALRRDQHGVSQIAGAVGIENDVDAFHEFPRRPGQ
jgi:hypothetical protein